MAEAVAAAEARRPRWRRAGLVDPDTLRAFAEDLGGRLADMRVEAMAGLVHHAPFA